MSDTCDTEAIASSLYSSLTTDSTPVPVVDLTNGKYTFTSDPASALYASIAEVDLDDLTTVAINGTGVFDKLMASAELHIDREFKAGRINADKYTEMYTGVMSSVLTTATQFTLAVEETKWNTIRAQMEARASEIAATKANVDLAAARANAAKIMYDMQDSRASYALTKLKLANTDAEHCLTVARKDKELFDLNKLMPADLAIRNFDINQKKPMEQELLVEQVEAARAEVHDYLKDGITPINGLIGLQKEALKFNNDFTLPKQLELLDTQYQNEYAKIHDTLSDGSTPILGTTSRQNILLEEQAAFVAEQLEAERSKTLDTRTDGSTPITGIMGRQRTLLDEQIELVTEQVESERAKTLDTRSDGSTVISGSVGKQKELYDEQISSFTKDAKYKTAKMYLDSWLTQKTLDEGITPPTEFENSAIDAVMSSIRATNGLT